MSRYSFEMIPEHHKDASMARVSLEKVTEEVKKVGTG